MLYPAQFHPFLLGRSKAFYVVSVHTAGLPQGVGEKQQNILALSFLWVGMSATWPLPILNMLGYQQPLKERILNDSVTSEGQEGGGDIPQAHRQVKIIIISLQEEYLT